MLHPTRRGFITGLGLFIAAPAIVRVSSLMPLSSKNIPMVIGTPEFSFEPVLPGSGVLRITINWCAEISGETTSNIVYRRSDESAIWIS